MLYTRLMQANDIPFAKRSCSRSKSSAVIGAIEAASMMHNIPDWKLSNDATTLLATFTLSDFQRAIAFVNLVANIAEKEDHHPNMYVHDYNSVSLTLTTRSAGGLTENDFILAAKIDLLAGESPRKDIDKE